MRQDYPTDDDAAPVDDLLNMWAALYDDLAPYSEPIDLDEILGRGWWWL